MKYVPKLNDYVSWRNVEGWVYYVDETHLTIEISVKPKEDDLVPMHRKHHCLVVVQNFQYDELVYVNSRRYSCLLYTSPSPRDATLSRMPSSA